MKQLVTMEIVNCEDKHRSKALKIVAGVPGVESVSLQGEDKNHIAVIGEGIDAVNMVNILRRKLRHVKLVSVSPVDEYDSGDITITAPEVQCPTYSPRHPYQAVVPHYNAYGYESNYYDNPGYKYNDYDNSGYRSNNSDSCSIM